VLQAEAQANAGELAPAVADICVVAHDSISVIVTFAAWDVISVIVTCAKFLRVYVRTLNLAKSPFSEVVR
jgi:hypothetical protein